MPTREEVRETMTGMHEHPDDIDRWCRREILWNGEPVWVQAPSRSYPVSQADEE